MLRRARSALALFLHFSPFNFERSLEAVELIKTWLLVPGCAGRRRGRKSPHHPEDQGSRTRGTTSQSYVVSVY